MFVKLSAVTAALAALLWIVPAQAEHPATAMESMEAQPSQAEVSDEQLRQFVDAATEVQTVQQEYAAQVQSSGEAADAESLRQEAQQKMVEAVEDTGLSVNDFNLIAQRLQQDPLLAERLNAIQAP